MNLTIRITPHTLYDNLELVEGAPTSPPIEVMAVTLKTPMPGDEKYADVHALERESLYDPATPPERAKMIGAAVQSLVGAYFVLCEHHGIEP